MAKLNRSSVEKLFDDSRLASRPSRSLEVSLIRLLSEKVLSKSAQISDKKNLSIIHGFANKPETCTINDLLDIISEISKNDGVNFEVDHVALRP